MKLYNMSVCGMSSDSIANVIEVRYMDNAEEARKYITAKFNRLHPSFSVDTTIIDQLIFNGIEVLEYPHY